MSEANRANNFDQFIDPRVTQCDPVAGYSSFRICISAFSLVTQRHERILGTSSACTERTLSVPASTRQLCEKGGRTHGRRAGVGPEPSAGIRLWRGLAK
jgi:hypothetical protein